MSRGSHGWGSIQAVAQAGSAARPFTSFAAMARVCLPGGRPANVRVIDPAAALTATVEGLTVLPSCAVTTIDEGSSGSCEDAERKVAWTVATPFAEPAAVSICRAGTL